MQKQRIKVSDYPILESITENDYCDDKKAFNKYYKAFSTNKYTITDKEAELINRLELKFGQRMKGR